MKLEISINYIIYVNSLEVKNYTSLPDGYF